MIGDMSMEGLAEVIKNIITAETKSPPLELTEVTKVTNEVQEAGLCVIGHSMGGYITLALVEKYPELVSSFGLFHSSAFADSEEKKTTRRKGIEFINQHGAFEFLKTAIPNLFSPDSKEQIPGSIQKLIEAGNNFKPQALVSYYEAMMQRPDRTAILSKTAVPVLFIMGKYDAAVPVEDSLKQCHLPQKSYIHVLQNSGHMGMLEEAEKSNHILLHFLSNF
jgi:pimeloyl-ACP methyl ester carboxylesterase